MSMNAISLGGLSLFLSRIPTQQPGRSQLPCCALVYRSVLDWSESYSTGSLTWILSRHLVRALELPTSLSSCYASSIQRALLNQKTFADHLQGQMLQGIFRVVSLPWKDDPFNGQAKLCMPMQVDIRAVGYKQTLQTDGGSRLTSTSARLPLTTPSAALPPFLVFTPTIAAYVCMPALEEVSLNINPSQP